jgi:hypothetical protein
MSDDVLYDGPLGAHMVQAVPHLLKVRAHASPEHRIAAKVNRENRSPKEAEKLLRREDKRRLALARRLFGADDDNRDLFDLWVETSTAQVATAASAIAGAASQTRYKSTTYSIRCLEEQELSSRVRAALVEFDPDVGVRVHRGEVEIRTRVRGWARRKRVALIERRAAEVAGVQNVKIRAVQDLIDPLGRP